MNRELVATVVGNILKEQRADLMAEIRRADRAFELVRAIEGLRINESISRLRTFIRTVAHEKSRIIEVRDAQPAAWIASFDGERAA
jgi:hypothetical protein